METLALPKYKTEKKKKKKWRKHASNVYVYAQYSFHFMPIFMHQKANEVRRIGNLNKLRDA